MWHHTNNNLMTEFTPIGLRLRVQLPMLSLYIYAKNVNYINMKCSNPKNNVAIMSRTPKNLA